MNKSFITFLKNNKNSPFFFLLDNTEEAKKDRKKENKTKKEKEQDAHDASVGLLNYMLYSNQLQ